MWRMASNNDISNVIHRHFKECKAIEDTLEELCVIVGDKGSYLECAKIVFPIIFETIPETSPDDYVGGFKDVIEKWGTLIAMSVPFDYDCESEFLRIVIRSLPKRTKVFIEVLEPICRYLYQQNVIGAESFLEWEDHLKNTNVLVARAILECLESFFEDVRSE